MTKIQEAQQILSSLGLPKAQQNEISAITLLALANLEKNDSWKDAVANEIRIHDVIEFSKKYGRGVNGKGYKENTREVVRRQVIHQLMQAGIVTMTIQSLATNSPRTKYKLTDEAFGLICKYGGKSWKKSLVAFAKGHKSLAARYSKAREMEMIPVVLPSGMQHLTPGKHNKLQVDVLNEFAPRFVKGVEVLYFGDTAHKGLFLNKGRLKSLGLSLNEHAKLPDIIIFEKAKNRLFLIEVVTSHGPVSPKRQEELEVMFSPCKLGRVYLSAFPDLKEFKRHVPNIAWETEVWISEIPGHMIHFNGDKFLKTD